jgi:hypothetical protein
LEGSWAYTAVVGVVSDVDRMTCALSSRPAINSDLVDPLTIPQVVTPSAAVVSADAGTAVTSAGSAAEGGDCVWGAAVGEVPHAVAAEPKTSAEPKTRAGAARMSPRRFIRSVRKVMQGS